MIGQKFTCEKTFSSNEKSRHVFLLMFETSLPFVASQRFLLEVSFGCHLLMLDDFPHLLMDGDFLATFFSDLGVDNIMEL